MQQHRVEAVCVMDPIRAPSIIPTSVLALPHRSIQLACNGINCCGALLTHTCRTRFCIRPPFIYLSICLSMCALLLSPEWMDGADGMVCVLDGMAWYGVVCSGMAVDICV